jgi:hypothetical protein
MINKTISFAIKEAYEKGYLDGLTSSQSNSTNWEEQNKLRQQWIQDNPNAEYEGWMSI